MHTLVNQQPRYLNPQKLVYTKTNKSKVFNVQHVQCTYI